MADKPTRTCPSCRVRWLVGREISPNFDLLPVDVQTWEKLRRAAEAFDRRASNADCGSTHPDHPVGCEECTRIEGQSGAGDGRLYTAAEFIEWIKADTTGYKVGHDYHFEGISRQRRDPGMLQYVGSLDRKDAA